MVDPRDHEFTVRRLHSRRRRFVAPGARWDLLAGVEALGDDTEFRFDVVVRYEFDYLFGGATALAAEIAAANAAALAFQDTEAAVLAGKKRKRREAEAEAEEGDGENEEETSEKFGRRKCY